jgi:hypothetical protein
MVNMVVGAGGVDSGGGGGGGGGGGWEAMAGARQATRYSLAGQDQRMHHHKQHAPPTTDGPVHLSFSSILGFADMFFLLFPFFLFSYKINFLSYLLLL